MHYKYNFWDQHSKAYIPTYIHTYYTVAYNQKLRALARISWFTFMYFKQFTRLIKNISDLKINLNKEKEKEKSFNIS